MTKALDMIGIAEKDLDGWDRVSVATAVMQEMEKWRNGVCLDAAHDGFTNPRRLCKDCLANIRDALEETT